jgi:hypothetical protein
MAGYVNLKTGERERNSISDPRPIIIENLRGKEDAATLDTAGFQLFHRPSKHTAFTDHEEIKKEYYPESVELFKEITGASRVFIFDHVIRRRRPGQMDTGAENRRQPFAQVHGDQTTRGAISRVHLHLPASDAPALLEKRFQIVNLWRPIGHPAFDFPLGICDYRTLDTERDTYLVSVVRPDGDGGEMLGVKYNESQKWSYFYGMTPEEFVLIKCFDSVQDGSVAVFCPHTAFEDPATPEGALPRESIELRALVFYD